MSIRDALAGLEVADLVAPKLPTLHEDEVLLVLDFRDDAACDIGAELNVLEDVSRRRLKYSDEEEVARFLYYREDLVAGASAAPAGQIPIGVWHYPRSTVVRALREHDRGDLADELDHANGVVLVVAGGEARLVPVYPPPAIALDLPAFLEAEARGDMRAFVGHIAAVVLGTFDACQAPSWPPDQAELVRRSILAHLEYARLRAAYSTAVAVRSLPRALIAALRAPAGSAN